MLNMYSLINKFIKGIFPKAGRILTEGILSEGIMSAGDYVRRGLCPTTVNYNRCRILDNHSVIFASVNCKHGVWSKQLRDFHGLGQGSLETNLFLHHVTDGRLN